MPESRTDSKPDALYLFGQRVLSITRRQGSKSAKVCLEISDALAEQVIRDALQVVDFNQLSLSYTAPASKRGKSK